MAPPPTDPNHPNHPPLHHSDYPRELSSFLHRHLLTLMIRNPLVPSRTHRICDVCREFIDGDFYGCNHCHFHVHPYCTHLPKSLRHVIDPTHKLRLHKLSAGCCSVCKADCSSFWVYGCDDCRVNVHLRCLLKPLGSREKTDQPSGSRGIHNHHHAPPPPWVTGPPHFPGGFPAGGWAFPNGHVITQIMVDTDKDTNTDTAKDTDTDTDTDKDKDKDTDTAKDMDMDTDTDKDTDTDTDTDTDKDTDTDTDTTTDMAKDMDKAMDKATDMVIVIVMDTNMHLRRVWDRCLVLQCFPSLGT
ncbi:hypothetical protein SDJN03_11895, partial [Cucurbita argyrosperma subsp. sororia]